MSKHLAVAKHLCFIHTVRFTYTVLCIGSWKTPDEITLGRFCGFLTFRPQTLLPFNLAFPLVSENQNPNQQSQLSKTVLLNNFSRTNVNLNILIKKRKEVDKDRIFKISASILVNICKLGKLLDIMEMSCQFL